VGVGLGFWGFGCFAGFLGVGGGVVGSLILFALNFVLFLFCLFVVIFFVGFLVG
jgi:hypothetical protein